MSDLSERVRRAVGVGSLALLTASGALALAAAPASAAAQTRYVATNGSDGGQPANDCTVQADPCQTIQHAVDEAAAGDTISVGAGTYAESVSISKSLTLVGAGSTGSGRTTVEGDAKGGPSIWIEGADTNTPPVVTIRAVDATGNKDDDGIYVYGATAHISDCVVSDNVGDGIGVEGTGSATVDNSLVSGNGDSGVLLYESASAVITNSTLQKNVGAGIVVDSVGASATVRTSTVSSTVPFSSGGVEIFGGGVLVFGGTANIQTSTVAGNTGQGVLSLAGRVTVANSTIAGTKEPAGGGAGLGLPFGGIAVENDLQPLKAQVAAADETYPRNSASHGASTRSSAKATASQIPSTAVSGTIVAKNTSLPDCAGPVVDTGYNLSSDAKNTCGFSAAKHDLVKSDPKLGPLADNGGATKTLLPGASSPALNVIPAGKAGCVSGATDQRGLARPRPEGGQCDIGAVEVAAPLPPVVIHPASLPHGTVGEKYRVVITATGGKGFGYVWSLAPGTTLPAGLTFSRGGVLSGTPTKAGTSSVTVSVDDPTLKRYTLVIDPATAPNDNGTEPIANTGSNVLPLSTVGGAAVLAGLLMLMAAGLLGRRPGRHRG